MTRQISESRKTAYYIGMAITGLGGLLFGSSFIVFLIGMSSRDMHSAETFGIRFAYLATAGMLLLILGGAIRSVAAKGLAGSGVILDPEKARQDLEPYSRMAGGVVKDALDEAQIRIGQAPEKVVMIKCPACGKLNEEDSRFCQECGRKF